jgi:hypothetical protein
VLRTSPDSFLEWVVIVRDWCICRNVPVWPSSDSSKHRRTDSIGTSDRLLAFKSEPVPFQSPLVTKRRSQPRTSMSTQIPHVSTVFQVPNLSSMCGTRLRRLKSMQSRNNPIHWQSIMPIKSMIGMRRFQFSSFEAYIGRRQIFPAG